MALDEYQEAVPEIIARPAPQVRVMVLETLSFGSMWWFASTAGPRASAVAQ